MNVHFHEAATATAGDSTVNDRFENFQKAFNQLAGIVSQLIQQTEALATKLESVAVSAVSTECMAEPESEAETMYPGDILQVI